MSTARPRLQDAATWLRESPIARQFGWLAIAKVTQGVSSLAAGVAIARSLGPDRYGLLSLVVAVASLVSMAASLGLEQIATRELAAASSQRHGLALLRRMRLAGGALGSVLLAAIAWMPMLRDAEATPLVLVLALLPLAQAGDLWEWRLLAVGRGRHVAIVTAIVALLAALGRIAFASASVGIDVFVWLLVGEFCVRSACLAALTRRFGMNDGNQTTRPSTRQAWRLLRESAPLLLAALAVFVYMRLDQFMIAALLGASQVGVYSAVVTMAELPLVLPMLLLRSALPTLTRQSSDGPSHRDRTLTALMGISFYLHLLVALVLSLAADPLLTLLYGEQYRQGATAFRLQIFASPFVALGVLSSAWLVLEHRTGHALRRTLLGAALNIALNFIAIPRWGIAGAAAATLAAQAFATWLADALYQDTRSLFIMKTRALWPGCWGRG